MLFSEAARACVAGEIPFRKFVEVTDRRWVWWAKRLARSGIPGWLSVEDLRQDLLVEAWRSMRRYDAEKAKTTTPAQWIETAAKNHAKKQVHRARGDDRHTWAWGPSRFELTFTSLKSEEDDEDFEIPVDPDQGRTRERHEAVMQVARDQGSLRDFFAVQALVVAEGDVEHAADILWSDLDVRLLCRLPSDRIARSIVSRVASRLAA